MIDPKRSLPDFSMSSRRMNGVKLVSRETALQIARLIHSSVEGAKSLAENEPLSVAESVDEWVVSGSRSGSYNGTIPGLIGPLMMRISQYDAQILSYAMALHPIASGSAATSDHTD